MEYRLDNFMSGDKVYWTESKKNANPDEVCYGRIIEIRGSTVKIFTEKGKVILRSITRINKYQKP